MPGIKVRLGLDNTAFNKGLESARASARQFAAGLNSRLLGSLSLVGLGYGVTRMVDQFAGFDRQMREVFTLMPDISREAMAKMTADVKRFAREFGVLPREVVPALYQALSAGVPPGNVFDFLATAQQAADGGVTDLTTAVDGLTSVINAYGQEAISVSRASDLMFTAVRLGKTTFEELSASLFQVNPIAAGLKLPFEEVTAALAALTAQGVPTSVAATQIRAVLTDLAREGSKAAGHFAQASGKSFQQFIQDGGSLVEALMLLRTHADGAGQDLVSMFGRVEAGSAALSLTGSDDFLNALSQMHDSAGATEKAYDRMAQSVSKKINRMKADLQAFQLDVAEAFYDAVYQDNWTGLQTLFMDLMANVFARAGGAIIDGYTEAFAFIRAGLITIYDATAANFRDGLINALTSIATAANNLPGINIDTHALSRKQSPYAGMTQQQRFQRMFQDNLAQTDDASFAEYARSYFKNVADSLREVKRNEYVGQDRRAALTPPASTPPTVPHTESRVINRSIQQVAASAVATGTPRAPLVQAPSLEQQTRLLQRIADNTAPGKSKPAAPPPAATTALLAP